MAASESGVNISMPQDLIKPIIEAKISAAICEHVGDPMLFITKIVGAALQTKVSSEGTVSNYSSDNRYTFLEVITQTAVRNAAKKCVEAWVVENQPLIEKSIVAELNRTKAAMAKVFAAGMVSAVKCDGFRIGCEVKFEGR